MGTLIERGWSEKAEWDDGALPLRRQHVNFSLLVQLVLDGLQLFLFGPSGWDHLCLGQKMVIEMFNEKQNDHLQTFSR